MFGIHWKFQALFYVRYTAKILNLKLSFQNSILHIKKKLYKNKKKVKKISSFRCFFRRLKIFGYRLTKPSRKKDALKVDYVDIDCYFLVSNKIHVNSSLGFDLFLKVTRGLKVLISFVFVIAAILKIYMTYSMCYRFSKF